MYLDPGSQFFEVGTLSLHSPSGYINRLHGARSIGQRGFSAQTASRTVSLVIHHRRSPSPSGSFPPLELAVTSSGASPTPEPVGRWAMSLSACSARGHPQLTMTPVNPRVRVRARGLWSQPLGGVTKFCREAKGLSHSVIYTVARGVELD